MKNRVFVQGFFVMITVVLFFCNASLRIFGETVSGNEENENIPNLGGTGNYELAIKTQNSVVSRYEQLTITVPATDSWRYNQSFARNEMFPALNAARMDPKNWHGLNEQNIDVPYDIASMPTAELEYDCLLEKAAMQRAIELAILYGHAKPNGANTVYTYVEQNNPYIFADNINELIGRGPAASDEKDTVYAYSYGISAEDLTALFMEDYAKKAGMQPHRQAILDGCYRRIGIGVVDFADAYKKRAVAILLASDTYSYDADAYGVELSNISPDGRLYYIPLAEETESVNESVPISITQSFGKTQGAATLGLWEYRNVTNRMIELYIGDEFEFGNMWFDNCWVKICFGNNQTYFPEGWQSDNESVATVSKTKITAKAPGTALIGSYDNYGNLRGYVRVNVIPRFEMPLQPMNKTGIWMTGVHQMYEGETYDFGNDGMVYVSSPDAAAAVCLGNDENFISGWTSSDPQLATVEGTKIKALSTGGADSKTVTVHAYDLDGRTELGRMTLQIWKKTESIGGEKEKEKEGDGTLQDGGIRRPVSDSLLTDKASGALYVINKDHTLTFSEPISKSVKKIVVPNSVKYDGITYKVTGIRKKAFEDCKNLKTVTIGENIKTVDKRAFYGCGSLKKIVIKSTKLRSVGKGAIKGIHKKAVITVPAKKYKAYKKLFKAATGYQKSMKLKKTK